MTGQKQTFQICFRGVRGSYPVPGPHTLRYGGNTTCHEVLVGGHRIILDGGTGIIPLGDELAARHRETGEPIEATVLFTHVHHDHMHGFLYFKPAYYRSTRVYIVGPRTFACNIEDALRDMLISPYHPVSLDEMGMKYEMIHIVGGETLRWAPDAKKPEPLPPDAEPGPDDVVIRSCANPNHTKLGVIHYRIEHAGKSYVFATDIEGTEEGEPTLVDFARGADLLAHDAQYTDYDYYENHPPKKGWGHSTFRCACATARAAGVKRLALIHHEPDRDDDGLDALGEEAKKFFPEAFVAREGMTVDL